MELLSNYTRDKYKRMRTELKLVYININVNILKLRIISLSYKSLILVTAFGIRVWGYLLNTLGILKYFGVNHRWTVIYGQNAHPMQLKYSR